MINDIERTRLAIDGAVDAWLAANGVSDEVRNNGDYSFFDNELNDLLEYLK